MIISAIITSYYVLGAIFTEKDITLKTFSFELPFPHFRDLDQKYWDEVRNEILAITGGVEGETKIYVATQDENLLKLNVFEGIVRISDLLSTSKLPLVYLGETKASIKGVISPFVINPGDFYKWFYLAENINQVENYFYNRRAYGVKKPTGDWEEGFEQSLFREKISYIFDNFDRTFFDNTNDLILTGEGLVHAGDNNKVALSFLDGCNIEGFWRIYLDRNIITLNIQNMGYYNLPLATKFFESLKLHDLAGCLIVPGAREVEIKTTSGAPLKINLNTNSVSVVPFDNESSVDIKVKFDKKTKFIKVSGGDLGLVIDNRLRPLLSDKNSKQRIALIEKWLNEISSKIIFDKPSNEEIQEGVSDLNANLNLPTKNFEKKETAEPKVKVSVGMFKKMLSPKIFLPKNNLKKTEDIKKTPNKEPDISTKKIEDFADNQKKDFNRAQLKL